jgi:hypothetical protein
MAIITFDYKNDKVYVLLDNMDKIRETDDNNTTYTKNAATLMAGDVIVDDHVELCVIKA